VPAYALLVFDLHCLLLSGGADDPHYWHSGRRPKHRSGPCFDAFSASQVVRGVTRHIGSYQEAAVGQWLLPG